MRINLESFSFRHNPTNNYDYVIDARILDLRGHGLNWTLVTGLDTEVREVASLKPEYISLIATASYFVYVADSQDAKTINIGIGCLHGKHRSVVVVEGLVERLNTLHYYDVTVYHRQLAMIAAEVAAR